MKKSYAAKCLLILLSIFILTSCSRNNKTKNEYIGTIHKTNYSEQHKIQLPKTVSCISAENEFYILDEKGTVATVYKGNIIKNLIMDCQSYTKYRPNETTGGIFVSWRRKEELSTGA